MSKTIIRSLQVVIIVSFILDIISLYQLAVGNMSLGRLIIYSLITALLLFLYFGYKNEVDNS